jgi:enoyl-CoA hydratase/carnithine racemase
MSPGEEQLLAVQPEPSQIEDGVGVVLQDGVAVVVLARPERHNALDLAAWRRIAALFTDLRGEPGLACVVVRGAGERAFGAGADIHEFPQVRMSPQAAVDYNESVAAALRAVAQLPQPVIAMIGGLAVGGGCELAAACDVRLAGARARFGIPIGRLGVTLGYTEAETLARIIGADMLKYLLFSGELIDAAEALRIGLVQRVVEPGELLGHTARLVGQIRASSGVTMQAAKAVAQMCGRPLQPTDTEQLTRFTVEAYGGPDLREGVAAFIKGREPQFAREREDRNGSA